MCVWEGEGGGGVGGKGEPWVLYPLYDSQLEFSRTMNLHRSMFSQSGSHIYIYTDSNNDHLRVAVHQN